MVEVASSRFSVEVTDLYKQRLGDEERRVEADFYREKTVFGDRQRRATKKSRKCPVSRELAAKKKRPAVVEFTAGRGWLGGGAETRESTLVLRPAKPFSNL